MRYFGGVALAFAALLVLAVPPASAGPAVVIDRDMLRLVTDSASSCSPDRVVFVTRDTRVTATCEPQPEPEPAVTSEAVVAAAVFVPAPPPTWRLEEGGDIHDALAAWLPSDWTLAWDTPATPAAGVSFQFEGDPMEAIAELFDRRSIWPEAPLIACSFPGERILQVRSAGQCGAP